MKKFGWLILVLSLMTYPQATTWKASLQIKAQGSMDYHVSKSSIHTSELTDTVDFSIEYFVEIGQYHLYGFDTLPTYTIGKMFYVVKDTGSLQFALPLDTSDSNYDRKLGKFVLDQGTYYPHEDIFFFRLTSKNWALCNWTYEDSSFLASNGVNHYQQAVRMYLACQVQDDGTTKFDSIPQYPHIPVASMPRARSFVPFLNEGRYQANGRKAFQASGVQLGRLGVQPELRK